MKLLSTIFFALVFLIFIAHISDWLCPFVLSYGCDVQYFDPNYSLGKVFFISVLAGPLLETVLFQLLPFKAYNHFITKNNTTKVVFIISSGLFFGLIHNYNVITIIDGFLSGVVLIFVFLKCYSHNKKAAFWLTFTVHSLYNLYAFIIDDVLRLS